MQPGPKIALVHDWLTGMRGGEKVLEVLCELYPQATLFTLLHNKGSVSRIIEEMEIHTSFIDRLPYKSGRYRNYLHGLGDCKIGGVPYARLFYGKGFNVFLYDSRRHGDSEGPYCTYGFHEKHDLSIAIDHLKSLTDTRIGKIGVIGTSMGAAVALQAAAIDQRIDAVVAEASFTDLRTIMVDYQKRIIKLPWHFLRNLAMSRSQNFAGFKARYVSPIHAVRNVRKPILFIHGTDDTRIRAEYSRALYNNANQPKELLLIHKGDHTDLLNVGGSEYEQRIVEFFEKYLSGKAAVG